MTNFLEWHIREWNLMNLKAVLRHGADPESSSLDRVFDQDILNHPNESVFLVEGLSPPDSPQPV